MLNFGIASRVVSSTLPRKALSSSGVGSARSAPGAQANGARRTASLLAAPEALGGPSLFWSLAGAIPGARIFPANLLYSAGTGRAR